MTPIGQNVLVRLLPERPRSTILYTEGIAPDQITRRGVVEATGRLCRNVKPGDTVLVRTTLGVSIGDLSLFPENACVATIVE
jgi:hypothetical protein